MGDPTATAAHMVGIGRDIPPNDRRRKVTPHETKAMQGEQITICNDTDDIIKIQFADENLFGTDRMDVEPGEELTLTAPAVVRRTECNYAIYCLDTAEFAHGSSMPIIIVEPKSS